jgi:hypothetical protein
MALVVFLLDLRARPTVARALYQEIGQVSSSSNLGCSKLLLQFPWERGKGALP